MRIGDLSARTGVSTRALRYYEEQGLLTSTRSSGGHRRFTEEDVGRVLYLQRLYLAGLSSQTILTLLPWCLSTPTPDNTDAAFARLTREREKLDAHIAELSRTRDSLDELIAANRAFRTSTAW
ncbi:DNA-binding transcriptional regulator, MerR family [Lentzea xinjiangensis]|uniref:DNA-binding transcriptional regulator, MerR family n=1 Tax=Lentzea xinjiangensis TaxID=402600 RepID=A0A1H9UFW2_9PSEU|nr:MerR family transcriptional regulator [Lentzea xinjiangensis]SES08239.1 DNA-binding transcriptional regulator, MerR family [Lentzea xinjiangensis]